MRGRGDSDGDDENCNRGMRRLRGPPRGVRDPTGEDVDVPPRERAPRDGGSSSSMGSCTAGASGSGGKGPNIDEIVRPPPEEGAEGAATPPIPPGAAARLEALLGDSEGPCLAAGMGDGMRDGGGETSSISSIGDGGASGGWVASRPRPAFLPSFGFGSLPPCI
ncbi:hypothetical protein [Dyella sp. SG609]|uniref:hypothetical protein n=1 Tax=Dyella sp. SG609 TaxID=2587018 RepID=UPI001446164F|nr:hypothetical protein [Dyella sp. SG609]NKJ20422.1 hypothetical protein [Dyella sp. SG609]